MKLFSLSAFRYLLLCLLFVSCSLFQDEEVDENLVEVTYFVPVYETTTQLAQKVSIDPPKDYAQAGKILTYQHYIFINNPKRESV